MPTRPPMKILHSIESTAHLFIQLQYRRDHTAAARELADRRAIAAAWDPEGDVREEVSSESRNWRTVDLFYRSRLPLARMLVLDASEFEDEQALVPFDLERIRRMVDARQEYLERKYPLFAAAGALDEIETPAGAFATFFGRTEGAMSRDVFDAATEQRAWRMQALAAWILGPDPTAELAAHCRTTFPDDPSYRANFWDRVLKDPHGELCRVRELAELRRKNEARRAETERRDAELS